MTRWFESNLSYVDKDIVRSIGHLNMVLDEYRNRLWPEEIDDIQRTLRVLQRLVKRQ